MAEAETSASVEDSNTQQAAVSQRPQMEVKIYAPFQVYYEGIGFSVSAVNEVGPFDILPQHRNFLCMLVPCTVKVQTPDGERSVPIKKALMHVKADRVVIFVDV